MQALTKKRRTKGATAGAVKKGTARISVRYAGSAGARSLNFRIPLGKVETARRFLANLETRFVELGDDESTVPADEAFKDLYTKYGKAGTILRGARAKEGLTQQQLAEKLGIEQPNVAAMESGKRPIGKEMAKRLAKVLNIDYRVFL